MSLEYYSRIRDYYSSNDRWIYEERMDYMEKAGSLFPPDIDGMFGFEPHAAKRVYKQMLEEAGVPMVMEDRLIHQLRGVQKNRDRIKAIETEAGNVYRGRMFIDATYEVQRFVQGEGLKC
jgi:hypothetical protein